MKNTLFKAATLLLFLAALLTARSQTAYQKLYWMGYNPGDLESINLNGTGQTLLHSTGHSVFSLDVDVPNQKIYWYDLDLDAIMRSDLNGSNASVFVANIIDAQGMSIDFVNQRLIWGSTSSQTIERINLDGTGRTTIVSNAFAGQPEGLKVDGTHQKVYWFDHQTYSMKRANLDGSSQETFISYTGGIVLQLDIDEANSQLYFPSMGSNTIERINLDGTGRTTLVSGFSNVGWPYAFTLDRANGKMYWWDGDAYVIRTANINGSSPQVFLNDIYSVSAMVVPFQQQATISVNPSPSTICAGANTSFSVTAANAVSYQWQVNNGGGYTNITNGGVYSGATTATLSITGATAAMNGYSYRAVVTGTSGVNSTGATLTVNSAPSFALNPSNESICENDNTTFSVSATNATGYQWQVNTGSGFTNISNGGVYSGATTSTLAITGGTNSMSGYQYRAVASGICTPAATSPAGTLTVYPLITYYFDNDGDGYGDPYFTTVSCTGTPFMFVANNLDCNDYDNTIYPSAPEICGDGIDNNCDGNIDESCGPVTQVRASQCNVTLPSVATAIYADAVSGATQYRFRVTEGANVQTIDRATNSFALNQLASYAFGVTYTVEVSVEYNGVFGSYGSACTVALAALKTKVQTSQCGATVASMSTLINANNIAGATQYRFRVINGANVQVIDRPTRSFSLNQLATYNYATTYTIDVAVETNGSFGAYGTACNVTSPALPLTQVQASQCGTTLSTISTAVFANNVTDATQYRFRVTNGANVQILDKPVRSFDFTELGSYTDATTYTVEVAVEILGSWGVYGPACNVTTPNTITKVRASQCGVTLVSIATAIYADVIGDATQYRFRVTNGANVQTIDRPSNSFNLTQLPNYGYGITYTIDVAVERNGTFGPYGTTCTVSTPVLVTKVQPSQCGITVTNIGTAILANNVAGATTYRFRVTNGANVQILDRPTRSFALNQLPVFASSTTYTIDVAVEMNGTFGAYGTACNVTSPSSPLTQVEAAQCGITLATISTPINADNIAAATQYRFRVTNGANVQTIDVPTRSFSLTQLGSYATSTTYTIEVAVMTGGNWGAYGPMCSVTTPATQPLTTQVRASQCGVTLTSIGTNILADAVSGATQYRFRVTEGANVQTIDKPSNSFAINQLGTFAYGTTYSVDVAVEVSGTFGAYGPICTVTTPKLTTKVRAAQCGITLASVSTPISANSVTGGTQYRFRVDDGTLVQTIDKPGVSFSLTELGTYALSTTYSIDVSVETNGTFGPYGPACNVSTGTSLAPMQAVELKSGAVESLQFDALTFPNPFKGEFGINVVTASSETISVTVYDVTGKVISVNTVSPQEIGNLKLGADLAAGIYQVQVVQGTEVKTLKVIKE